MLSNVIFPFVHLISCIVGNVAFVIIKMHHQNKPLGMETLLSRTTALLIKSCISGSVIHCGLMAMIGILDTVEDWLAVSMLIIGNCNQGYILT